MKNGFPQRNNSMNTVKWRYGAKESGSVQTVAGFYCLLFLGVFLYSQFQIFLFGASGMYLEDALAASNLAAAVADIEEYGASHRVWISDVWEAYARYQTAVKENLQLNESWEGANPSLISGVVKIEQFIVYNVEGEAVQISRISGSGEAQEEWGILGMVVTPEGTLVTHTGIYSEISFPVKGFAGITVQARKGKFVDIVREEGEEL